MNVRPLRILLAIVAAFLSTSTAAVAQEGNTGTSPPSAPTVPAGVSLVTQSTWVPLRAEFVMVLHLDNLALASRPGAAIAIRIHESASTRTSFDDVIANRDLGPVIYQPNPIPLSSLHPDKSRNVSIVLGLANSGVSPTIEVGRPGVYPVEVALTNTGVPTGTFVTWLVTVDTGSPHPVDNPLAVSFVWQLVADPATRPDGSIRPEVAAQMKPGSRLDRIATLLARAGTFPYSLVVNPETVETWKDLAAHDTHLQPGLARVRSAVARHTTELMPAPYVPIDLAALESAGLGDQVPAEYREGARALHDALGAGPADHAQAAFVDPANDAAVDRLREMLTDRVAVRDSSLIPMIHPFTPAQTFALDTAGGRSRAAATAPFVETLMAGTDPAALRAERVVAALAEVAYEQPGRARGLVLAPPARWTPDVATMTAIVNGLRNNPLIQPTTLDDFFNKVSNEQDANHADLERRLSPLAAAGTPLTQEDYAAATFELGAYADVVGAADPVVVQAQHDLLLALSTSMPPGDVRAILGNIDRSVHAFASGITTDAKRVTLTSKRARVPLNFVNTLKRPVDVRVHLDSPKLVFPDGADQTVRLRPGNNTIRFLVEARTSGTFSMTISVTSPNGRLAFGAPVRVTVRSAVFGGLAVALTIAALLFLAIWWANHFRRTRRGRITRTPVPAAT